MSSFKFDVFLSHNSRDKGRVRRIAERLQEHGLQVWLDEWVIKPGDDIYLAIERGLEHSRALVLCISPAALGSGWVNLERGTVLFRDPSNTERRFIPLLLADCDMPDTLKRYKYVDYRDETDEALQKLLGACAENQVAAGKTGQASIRQVKDRPTIGITAAKSNQELRVNMQPGQKAKRPSHGDKFEQEEHRTFFAIQDVAQIEVKGAIAQHVVATVLNEGDPILLDAGTSLCAVAKAIAARTNIEPHSCHYTILTHNLPAFEVLVKETRKDAHLNVVLAGGRYDADLKALFGNQTVFAIQDFFPRVVVVGISGLIANIGVFCHGNTEELDVKKCIFAKHARERVIVADYTKIGTGDAMRFGEAQTFLAGVEKCILVTNAPSKEASIVVKERFHRETEMLTQFGVSVEIVG